ncbi:hypothetical protein [Pseudomonas sp. PA15(2017)]|uniref:hypothetical protein n=1 Tax=Pseudomonas sp. PA15(2017) TaxID=1932111 RepID=UPI00117B5A89|nr:hypothetical protein [Pseudomonas sp. PA15(2017)]
MMKEVSPDEESPAGKINSEDEPPKRKMPYRNLMTELTLEDMSNPGVHKLMLAENSRLESELFKSEAIIISHHELRVTHAEVKGELDKFKGMNRYLDTLYSAGLGIGTALAGISISIEPFVVAFAVACLGIAIAGISVAARMKRYEN